jgi:uncharacterized protein (DUF39 family)
MTVLPHRGDRTHIFLGGGTGYVIWQGTQHSPAVGRTGKGLPKGGAATLAVIGDLRQMTPRFLRGASVRGYGASLFVGLGLPIPVLDEEIAAQTGVTDADILAPIVDYSRAYPNREPEVIGHVSYAQLKTGTMDLNGKPVPTTPLSSYPKAVEVATRLKAWIQAGKFALTAAVAPLPGAESGMAMRPMPYERGEASEAR